jgi:hypothetical protein
MLTDLSFSQFPLPIERFGSRYAPNFCRATAATAVHEALFWNRFGQEWGGLEAKP